MTKSSPQVFVVVDPVQDYEESLTILGVHGSLAAAKAATRRYRRLVDPPTSPGGISWRRVLPERDVEVQLWKGDQLLDTWTHHGERHHKSGQWTHTPGPGR